MSTTFPLTNGKLSDICDPKEYGNKKKYPYINYLPLTKPSKQFLEFAQSMLSGKAAAKANHGNIKALRQLNDGYNIAKLNEPDACDIEEFNINNLFDNNTVNGTKITYKGSNISNGAIIAVHGGCYCFLSHRVYFGVAELISKLSGCPVFLLNWKLAPEFPLPTAVNELIILYEYLLNTQKISSNLISMIGGSCGAGLILLALQSMKYGAKKELKLAQPACVVLNSPMINLAADSTSFSYNAENEILMEITAFKMCCEWAVGNRNAEGQIICNNDKTNEIYSAMNGRFDGLSAMYITVAANEILLDDALICAKKAYEANVSVRLDIEPFLGHIYPDFVGPYPEAYVANARIVQWILMHFNRYKFAKL